MKFLKIKLLGVAIAIALALVAGFQSDAFINALEGSGKEYLTLFAWGVGAEQTKTLIQNLEKPFRTDQTQSWGMASSNLRWNTDDDALLKAYYEI